MNRFLATLTITLLFTLSGCAQSQNAPPDRHVGGPCEGCEALLEYDAKTITSETTIPGYESIEPKLLIRGLIRNRDGSPAPNVILYVYHTDRKGVYAQSDEPLGWEQRHGQYRGWVKSNEKGEYTIHTFRPGPYPGRFEPEHIHMTVKEPDTSPYYIDDILFTDDPLLTPDRRKTLKNRGGRALCTPKPMGDYFLIKRDIILGMNIPGY